MDPDDTNPDMKAVLETRVRNRFKGAFQTIYKGHQKWWDAEAYTPGSIHRFRVRACCPGGPGPWSPEVVAQVPDVLHWDAMKSAQFINLSHDRLTASCQGKEEGSAVGRLRMSHGMHYWEVLLESAAGVGVGVSIDAYNAGESRAAWRTNGGWVGGWVGAVLTCPDL